MVSNFIKNSSFYLLIILIERSIIFIITPYLISKIPIKDFGAYSLFLTFESALMPLISLNLYSAISKEYYEDGYEFKQATSLLILTYIALSIFASLILFIISEIVPTILPFSIKSSIIAVYTSLSSSLIIYFQTYLKLRNKILQYALISISQSIFYFVLLFLAIKYFYFDVNVLFYSRLFLYLIILLSFILVTKSLGVTKNFILLKKTLELTLPTVIFSFSAFLFVMSDRFFISKYLGKAALGEYAAIYQIPALISLITGAFSTAWIPWLYENLKRSNFEIKVYIVKIIYILVILLIFGSLLFYLLIPYLGEFIFNRSFDFSALFIFFIVLGFMFQGIYNLISPIVFYSGKTKFHAYIGIVVSIVSVVLNYLLIPLLGLLGASVTFCLSWFLLSLLFFIATFYSYKMPWLFYQTKYK